MKAPLQAPTQEHPTGQFDAGQRAADTSDMRTTRAAGIADHRAVAVTQREQQEIIVNSPRVLQQKALAERINNSPRVLQQKAQIDTFRNIPRIVTQRQETAPTRSAQSPDLNTNKTGLPDQLKSGIEAMSGMSMDHVRVHYNSPRPAQLHAHAYAQGNDIHLGPGQEKHLPHEAWHVVQQAQGRVPATRQLKGVGVNDDPGLEREADRLGSQAARHRAVGGAYASFRVDALPRGAMARGATPVAPAIAMRSASTVQRVVVLNGVTFKDKAILKKKLERDRTSLKTAVTDNDIEEIAGRAELDRVYIYKGLGPYVLKRPTVRKPASVAPTASTAATSSTATGASVSLSLEEDSEDEDETRSPAASHVEPALAYPASMALEHRRPRRSSSVSPVPLAHEPDASDSSSHQVDDSPRRRSVADEAEERKEASEGDRVLSVSLGAVVASPSPADVGMSTYKAGRLLVHMITGTLSTPVNVDKGHTENAWQYDLRRIASEDGYKTSSNSLIPRPRRPGEKLSSMPEKTIYSAPFGLLTTATDEQLRTDGLLIAGHNDLGANKLKGKRNRGEDWTTERKRLEGGRRLVGNIEELNTRSEFSTSYNNEVVYDMKKENLLGILINKKVFVEKKNPKPPNLKKDVLDASVQAIAKYIQEKFGRLLPIFETEDDGKTIKGPYHPAPAGKKH